MNDNIQIESLRGSIFVPQKIVYSKDLISNLEAALSDFTPFVLPDDKSEEGPFVNTNNWCICSNSNNFLLVFLPQKVDYIERGNQPFSEESFNGFIERCKKVFDLLLEYSGLYATRLAIAPTFRQSFLDDEFIKFINDKIYKKNRFKNSSIMNGEFSQVFRLHEEINGQNVLMNYVSRFYSRNDDKTQNDVYMIDFDINTFPNQDNSFNVDALNDFYFKSFGFCTSFMKLYFEEEGTNV